MPSQIQRDLANLSETEPETDEEFPPVRLAQNQLVRRSVSQRHYSHNIRNWRRKMEKGYVCHRIYIDIASIPTAKYLQRKAEEDKSKALASKRGKVEKK
jgi:hypothetical protein